MIAQGLYEAQLRTHTAKEISGGHLGVHETEMEHLPSKYRSLKSYSMKLSQINHFMEFLRFVHLSN